MLLNSTRRRRRRKKGANLQSFVMSSLVKQTSYTSKSILSILQPTPFPSKSTLKTIHYFVPSSIFLLACLFSIWALPFYSILGLSYYIRSAVLLEDLRPERLEFEWNSNKFRDELNSEFHQLTSHCFFAAFLYFLVLMISIGVLSLRENSTHPDHR